jgi:hypothetical protein
MSIQKRRPVAPVPAPQHPANGKVTGKFISPNGSVLDINPGLWNNRVCIGIPMTGLVRCEWVHARYGQTVPTNWSHVEVCQYYSSFIPMAYQVADAENLIAKHVVEGNYEWLFFIEHDNILPPNTFIKMNHYMVEAKYPIVAGLYFTKSDPPEPLIYREPGRGYFDKWKMGDKVMAAGVPFGCTLIHGSIIRALWNESPEYTVNGQVTRRVFQAPSSDWADPSKGIYLIETGTSDLAWCKRLTRDHIFEKAGWPQFQNMKYPLLVDTSIFVMHITQDGTQYPLRVPEKFLPKGTVISQDASGVQTIQVKIPPPGIKPPPERVARETRERV